MFDLSVGRYGWRVGDNGQESIEIVTATTIVVVGHMCYVQVV